MNYKYWAFISYSSKDRAWGDWLIKAIETYKVPKSLVGKSTSRCEPVPARAFPIFRDRDELPTETNLGTMIAQSLEQSRYLIVICSPNSARSKWVNEEILTFKRLGRSDRIYSLIVDGSPNATDIADKDPKLECYPAALRFELGADGQLTTERTHPISADAREHGDGRQNALLKLLAGILGVNYDDLRQRDVIRRRRRLRLLLAASCALTLVFAALAIAAVIQRNEAVAQRERAVAARKQAESILNFLLFDLSDQLAPVGRLDIVARVQEKVNVYYRELGIDPGIDDQLRLRVASLLNQGDTLWSSGDRLRALVQYREALAANQILVQRDPSNPKWNQDLAVILNRIAMSLADSNQLDAALQESRRGLDALRRLDRTERTRQLTAANLNFSADLLVKKGNLAEARSTAEAGVSENRALLHLDPLKAQSRNILAEGLRLLGTIQGLQGDLTASLLSYEEAVEQLRQLVAQDAQNTIWTLNLCRALSQLSDATLAGGKHSAAQRHSEESLALIRVLTQRDPRNSEWREDLGICLNKIGHLREIQGNLQGALLAFDEDLQIARRTANEDPASSARQSHLALSLERVGAIHSKLDDQTKALAAYGEATALLKALVASDPDNRSSLHNYSVLLRQLAGIHVKRHELAAAMPIFEEALRISRELRDAEPHNTEWSVMLSVVLAEFGSAHLAQKNPATAEKMIVEAIIINRAQIANDPREKTRHSTLAVNLAKLAETQVAQGRLADAAAALRESVELSRQLSEHDQANIQWQTGLALRLYKYSAVLEQQGKNAAPAAIAAAAEALAVLRHLEQQGPLPYGQVGWIRGLASQIRELRAKWNLPPGQNDDPLIAALDEPQIRPLPAGQNLLKQALSAADAALDGKEYFHFYTLEVKSGADVQIDLRSNFFKPYLGAFDPNGKPFIENTVWQGDSGHARLAFKAHVDGLYRFIISSSEPAKTGAYELAWKVTP